MWSAPFAPEDGVFAWVAGPAADVILLDTGLADAVAVAREVVSVAPERGVVAFGFPTPTLMRSPVRGRDPGFVPCQASLKELVRTIESVARGEELVTPAAALFRRVATGGRLERTEARARPPDGREREILWLIDEGLSNKEVAVRLSMSLPTVNNHVHNILDKLG